MRRFVQGFEKDRTVVESLNRAGRSAVFSAGSETPHAERPRAHPESEAQPRLYRRPRGNAPAGKVWNYHTGVWVDNIAHSEPKGVPVASLRLRVEVARQRPAAQWLSLRGPLPLECQLLASCQENLQPREEQSPYQQESAPGPSVVP